MSTRRQFIASSGAIVGTSLLAGAAFGAAAPQINRRIVLAKRPDGDPTPADFRLEEVPIPALRDGEVLLRTVYLSLDPYMRARMSDAASYAAPTELNQVMVGGTVSRIAASRNPRFKEGDLVNSYSGWQEYQVSNGMGITPLDARIPKPSYALGVLGMPGLTAYVGTLDLGAPKPGETLAVAAATGAVGSVVGQIAKIKGLRAVGIAGGPEKCSYAVKELGFDACIDHRDADMPRLLKDACPKGIDVYFENVGGAVWDAVVPLLNTHARVPLCGLIAQYNATRLPPGPDRSSQLMGTFLTKQVKVQGFIISTYYHRQSAFIADMSTWLKEGRIKYREDITQGLENAPQAFMGLFKGSNFGKLLVQVSE
ncbi:MAG TPA: NADP-dependent oxidoreductase [Povalibacter sp.]|nr:NADP-dependent oxidoreductase [Povalibacter sp.]HMN44536.1 NADP-dependent oxidoreductase [Povalibacter sp.]